MDESGAKLAYRLRTAVPSDEAALKATIGATLAHPDPDARRSSYRGAASRGDILVLEHFDRQEREWHVAGFVEHHLRVDDSLTIRDAGTPGSEPQAPVVRYMLDELLASLKPREAQVKIRRDAQPWLEIFDGIPGFHMEGEEYRRPHYWTVWTWEASRARDEARARADRMRGPGRPTPPRPPAPRPFRPEGARPGPRRPPGPRQDGSPTRGRVNGPSRPPGRPRRSPSDGRSRPPR